MLAETKRLKRLNKKREIICRMFQNLNTVTILLVIVSNIIKDKAIVMYR